MNHLKHFFQIILICGTVTVASTFCIDTEIIAAPQSTKSVVADKDLGFTCLTDKNPVLYKTGEQMKFIFELVDRETMKPVKGRMVRYVRNGDDGKKDEGTFVSDSPFVYTTNIDKPGFVRIQLFAQNAENQDIKDPLTIFDGGAGADVNAIPAAPPPPRILIRFGKTK